MKDDFSAKIFSNESKFARFMNVLADILVIGILWLVCSLPVITLGTASTAAYYAIAKTVRFRTGKPVEAFFHSFRVNLKQGLLFTLGFIVAIFFLVIDFVYLWGNENPLNDALFVILILVAFIVLAMWSFLNPLLSRFDRSGVELLRMSLFLSFRYLPITIGILAAFFVCCIAVYLMPWAILVVPGLYIYTLTFPMECIFRRMLPKVEDGSEDAEKWYFQTMNKEDEIRK